jgi:hypothetical protein
MLAIAASVLMAGCNAPLDTGDRAISAPVVDISLRDGVALGALNIDAVTAASHVLGEDPLRQAKKPRVLYVGAEYCHYCAMERWSLVIALSQFGTFAGLHSIDIPGSMPWQSLPTVSFRNATFTSDHVTFEAVELEDAAKRPLDALTSDDRELMDRLDPDGSIPWVSWGTGYRIGTLFDASSQMEGKSTSDIAAELSGASSPVAKMILGSANVQIAQICASTEGKPADICGSETIKHISSHLTPTDARPTIGLPAMQCAPSGTSCRETPLP